MRTSLILVLLFVSYVYSNFTLPLHTQSRWIVDPQGKRVKLACVNWYGGESGDYVVGGLQANTMDSIASLIKTYGFNCVRLLWSNEGYQKNPVVTDSKLVMANQGLLGLHALDIFDKVVEALANQDLLVILDNHVSDASWCCSTTDGNGLWYNSRYSADSWVSDWKGMALRYKGQSHVIGADLRNELRTSCDFSGGCRTPVWGGGDVNLDWRLAAQTAADAIGEVNSDLLIFVEGLSYALDLKGVYTNPLTLKIANRLVYEAHDYSWSQGTTNTCDQLHTTLGDNWGFILEQGKAFTAPVWVGEWGNCHTGADCISGNPGTAGYWFECFMQYLSNADIDWGWWALDGTESSGSGRVWGAEETFGVLNLQWNAPAYLPLLQKLYTIQNATQGP